jgi:hypothetical protein
LARFVENSIVFPYKRSLGPVIGRFMTALTEQRILGIRSGDQVLVPPTEWDPATGAELDADDLVDVGPAGTVVSWTWVPDPTEQHPLDVPFAFALIQLDGASTPLLHALDAGSRDAVSTGMRVAPRWRGRRTGRINDIVAFVPGEDPEVEGVDAGPADEPVTMMDYDAAITYRNPVPPVLDRVREASRDQRILGQRCPVCARVYAGGRGYCPIDAVELGEDTDVDLPHTGTITNFTIVTPVQYPGQTETDPFARVFVLLDGTDVVLPYQPVVELAVEDVHVGTRVAAAWAPANEDVDEGGTMGGAYGHLIGWIPTGEPTLDDPDLVNRIF